MCGILGVVGNIEAARPRFAAALDSIAHRGPDGEGTLTRDGMLFGHRRLAIIDLSPGGHQPMADDATGTVLTFNGEIYNYVEVRAELESLGVRFRSQSDTEVLLRAFLHWREAMFARLNGMWAFAIWEPATGLLTLARDRFGVKPLYWHAAHGTLRFASEPKALIALDPALAEADPAAVYELVVNSRSHAGDMSFYKAIRALPAATCATFRIGDAQPRQALYWQFPAPLGEPPAPAAANEQFAALFDDAVRLRQRSDVPLGLTLSGGLDSSAVLAAAHKRSGAPIHCFTSVYSAEERGEEHWAQIAAAAGGGSLESVVADQSAWLPTLQQIVHHMDGPGFTPSVFPLWAIMRRAREAGVPVLLEGQGADELLAGYPQYAAVAAAAMIGGTLRGRVPPHQTRAMLEGLRGTFGGRGLMLWMLRQQAKPLFDAFGPHRQRRALFRSVPETLRESARVPAGYSALHAALHADHADRVLPSLLHYGDAVSMAHGIEARLPFMDYRLVEWVFRSRPPLIVDGRTKAPVRAYLAANGMQRIADRADKQGYPTMVARWVNEGEGQQLIGDLLASPNAPLWSMLDRPAVGKLVEQARRGAFTPVFHLYKLVATQVWLDRVRPDAPAHRPVREPRRRVAA